MPSGILAREKFEEQLVSAKAASGIIGANSILRPYSIDTEGQVFCNGTKVRGVYRGRTVFTRQVFRDEDQLNVIQEAIYAVTRARKERAIYGDDGESQDSGDAAE